MRKYSIALFGMSLWASNLCAQADEFERTEVLDKPRYSLTDRVSLDAGITFLPLDAYYKPILLEGAIAYQPTDWLSLEPVRFGWSVHNYDTGLTRSVEDTIHSQTGKAQKLTSDQELNDLRFRAGSLAYFNLLYSKSNWFNQAVVYHYWQLGGGAMYYDMKSKSQIAAELAMRVRFFINNSFLFDIRAGHSLGFKSEAPKNITSITTGVGFAF